MKMCVWVMVVAMAFCAGRAGWYADRMEGWLGEKTVGARVVSPLIAHTQDGTTWCLGAPDDDEDAWVGTVQRLAREQGEALAVTQDDLLVCIINP